MTPDTSPEQIDPEDERSSEEIERVSVAALDKILGKKFKVLDDGFIRVVDYLGADESIVQAARVSYGKGTKKVQEDRGLIRYLLRHRHTTPFEMCEIKLHVRVPMDCWRQWIRHRTANVNEYSTRYSVAMDSAQRTTPYHWRLQSEVNRQGSGGFLNAEAGSKLSAQEAELHEQSKTVYQERLAAGVAREQARKDLPLATYTEAYWKIDLWNLLHFLALRMDSHAQWEIRSYALTIGEEIVKKWVPIAWNAFLDYHFNSLRLSSIEVEVMKHLFQKDRAAFVGTAAKHGWLTTEKPEKKLSRNREREEFEVKMRAYFGIDVDWTV